jgi:hypothetical protein
VRDAAAAVNCQTRRLVDGQQCVVLEKNAETHDGTWRGPDGLRRGDANGRDANDVAGGEPTIRAHPTLVHPDFAGAKHSVNVAFWDTLQHADEKIVDPLAGGFLADSEPIDSILA